MKTKTVAIIVASGDRYGYLSINAAHSVIRAIPHVEVHVVTHKLSALDIALLKSMPKVTVTESENYDESSMRNSIAFSQRVKFQHFLTLPNEVEDVLLLDADAMLTKNPFSLLPEEFEICLTFKPERLPLNAGVMYLRNLPKVRHFAEETLKAFEKIDLYTDEYRTHLIQVFGGLAQGILMDFVIREYDLTGIELQGLVGTKIFPGKPTLPSIDAVDAAIFNNTKILEDLETLPTVVHFKSMTRVYIENFGVDNFAVFGSKAAKTLELFDDSLYQAWQYSMNKTVQRLFHLEESNRASVGEGAEPGGRGGKNGTDKPSPLLRLLETSKIVMYLFRFEPKRFSRAKTEELERGAVRLVSADSNSFFVNDALVHHVTIPGRSSGILSTILRTKKRLGTKNIIFSVGSNSGPLGHTSDILEFTRYASMSSGKRKNWQGYVFFSFRDELYRSKTHRLKSRILNSKMVVRTHQLLKNMGLWRIR